MPSVATARANIALVKYWGKRDAALNLPARGSLSLTGEVERLIEGAGLARRHPAARLVFTGGNPSLFRDDPHTVGDGDTVFTLATGRWTGTRSTGTRPTARFVGSRRVS